MQINVLLFFYSWLLNIWLYLQITADLQTNLVAQLRMMHLASCGSSHSNPPPLHFCSTVSICKPNLYIICHIQFVVTISVRQEWHCNVSCTDLGLHIKSRYQNIAMVIFCAASDELFRSRDGDKNILWWFQCFMREQHFKCKPVLVRGAVQQQSTGKISD